MTARNEPVAAALRRPRPWSSTPGESRRLKRSVTISRETLRRILRAGKISWKTTTTYGSWLNWIESEFAALRYFALNGTDHRSHDEQNAAYVRWRNTRTKPKTNFAPDSPIRSWTDYPAKAA